MPQSKPEIKKPGEPEKVPGQIVRIYQRDYSAEPTFQGQEFEPKTQFVFINEDGDEFTVRANPISEYQGGIEIRVNRMNTADGLIIHPKVGNTIAVS